MKKFNSFIEMVESENLSLHDVLRLINREGCGVVSVCAGEILYQFNIDDHEELAYEITNYLEEHGYEQDEDGNWVECQEV